MASKFDHIINKYWPADTDRKIARAFVEKFGDMPGMEDRIPSMLLEAASTADRIAGGSISLDEGRNYLASFATDGLGLPPHVIAPLAEWFDGPGIDAAAPAEQPPEPAEPAQPAQPVAAPPAPPVQPATLTARESLQPAIDMHLKNMNSPLGSEPWKKYWREGGAQDYLKTLQVIEAAEAEEAVPPPVIAAAAAAPAAEPAAPGA